MIPLFPSFLFLSFSHFCLQRPARPYVSNGLQNNWLSDFIPVPQLPGGEQQSGDLRTSDRKPAVESDHDTTRGASPMRSLKSESMFGDMACPFALLYDENGQGQLLEICSQSFTVTKKALLAPNPSQDFQLRQSMDGSWFVSSAALQASHWAAWLHSPGF